MVIEDDVDFPANWNRMLEEAMVHGPDFDLMLIGSCNTEGKPKKHLGGPIWIVDGPQCTHAYIVTKSAARRLIEQQRKIYAPIDLALLERSYPHLKVLTVLPRIASQRGTSIQP